MLAWSRREGESSRAFAAFELYRDMGAERSVTKVAQELDKSRTLIGRWSSQHDWVDRVKALEARDEMVRREAVEAHVQANAEDRAKREADLLSRGLSFRESAMDRAERMVAWPLAEQRVVREGPDGQDATYIFQPSRWSVATAIQLYNAAVGNAPAEGDPGDEMEFDFDGWDEADLMEFMRLSERLTPKRKSDG